MLITPHISTVFPAPHRHTTSHTTPATSPVHHTHARTHPPHTHTHRTPPHITEHLLKHFSLQIPRHWNVWWEKKREGGRGKKKDCYGKRYHVASQKWPKKLMKNRQKREKILNGKRHRGVSCQFVHYIMETRGPCR